MSLKGFNNWQSARIKAEADKIAREVAGEYVKTAEFQAKFDARLAQKLGVAGGAASFEHGHAISGVTGLQTALDGKATSSHGHDDRYFTETEINNAFTARDNAIAGKQPAGQYVGVGVNGLGQCSIYWGGHCNDIRNPGFYSCPGAGTPTGGWSHIIHISHVDANYYFAQLAICYHGGGMWMRVCSNGWWGSWLKCV